MNYMDAQTFSDDKVLQLNKYHGPSDCGMVWLIQCLLTKLRLLDLEVEIEEDMIVVIVCLRLSV